MSREVRQILDMNAFDQNSTGQTGAVARRDSQLIRIPRALFRRMLDEYPESAYRLHQKISRSMRSCRSSAEISGT